MSASVEPPESIGPYRVVRPVARGGMAAVYEVVDPETGRHLALKLLERRFRGQHRFGREYRALTRLDHPNIVRVYRFGVANDGTPFLTMELLDGVPAQVHAKRCGRPGTPERTREAVRLIGEVARALAYLHSRGIVHRDLKSSNVLVLRDGRVKVLDFGTARLADANEAITRHGEFVGTYAYAAPEQFDGGAVDARTDLYSLGVLFYRLLTGHRPFDSEDPEELRRMHTHDVPRQPCARVPGIPDEVGAVVMALLRKIPDDRPDSAAWVIQALQRHSGDRPRQAPLPAPEVAGRTDVVRALRVWLETPDAASGQVRILGGPLGVGAHRVLRQVQTDATKLGWTTTPLTLTSVPGIRGLADLVRAVCRWGGVRADPELGFVLAAVTRSPSPGAPTVETPERLVRVIQRAIERHNRPIVLVVRGLDDAPDDVLAMLAQVCACGPTVAMVASVAAASDAVRTRLAELLPGCGWLDLQPLGRLDSFRLVGSVLGVAAPPPRLVERIHRATGGRPGFMVDVVHAMQAQGLTASQVSGGSIDLSGGQVPLPPSVAQAVRGQLRAYSTPQRRVLQVLALAGSPVAESLIADVTGATAAETHSHLRALERAWLVHPLAEGAAWQLAYDLLGEVVRSGLRPTRRDVLVRRIAAALEGASPSPGLVRLLLEAGQLADASRVAVLWGQRAMDLDRPDLVAPVVGRVAHAWARSAKARGCPGPLLQLQAAAWVRQQPGGTRASEVLELVRRRPDVPQAASAFLLARHLRWRPDLDRAREQLELAERLAIESDDLPTLTNVALARAEDAVAQGQFAHAESVLVALEERTRRRLGAIDQVRLGVARAQVWVARGNGARALASMASCAGLGPKTGTRGRVLIASGRAAALGVLGRWSEMIEAVLGPALSEVRLRGGPVAHAELLVQAVAARIALFQLGEARELLDESRAAGPTGPPSLRIRRAGLDGLLKEAAGDHSAAVTMLRAAAESARRHGMRVEDARVRAVLGRALVRAGHLDEALGVFDDAARTAADLEAGPHVEHVAACRVEALLVPEVRASVPWRALVAQARGLSRSAHPETRLRSCVALLGPGVLRADEGLGVVASALEALDVLEAGLQGESRMAIRVHPWRVTVDRASARLRSRSVGSNPAP